MQIEVPLKLRAKQSIITGTIRFNRGSMNSLRLIDIFNNPQLSSATYDSRTSCIIIEDAEIQLMNAQRANCKEVRIRRPSILFAYEDTKTARLESKDEKELREMGSPIYETKTLQSASSFKKEQIQILMEDGTFISGTYQKGVKALSQESVQEFIVLANATLTSPALKLKNFETGYIIIQVNGIDAFWKYEEHP